MTTTMITEKSTKNGRIKRYCGDAKCARYSMSLAEFKILCGEARGSDFDAKLGKAATKLYKEIYGKAPPTIRCKIAENMVKSYPCGIIEQAYRELCASGFLKAHTPAS